MGVDAYMEPFDEEDPGWYPETECITPDGFFCGCGCDDCIGFDDCINERMEQDE